MVASSIPASLRLCVLALKKTRWVDGVEQGVFSAPVVAGSQEATAVGGQGIALRRVLQELHGGRGQGGGRVGHQQVTARRHLDAFAADRGRDHRQAPLQRLHDLDPHAAAGAQRHDQGGAGGQEGLRVGHVAGHDDGAVRSGSRIAGAGRRLQVGRGPCAHNEELGLRRLLAHQRPDFAQKPARPIGVGRPMQTAEQE